MKTEHRTYKTAAARKAAVTVLKRNGKFVQEQNTSTDKNRPYALVVFSQKMRPRE